MLQWCVYCQEFRGEVTPFDNFDITHGVCSSCKAKGLFYLETKIERAKLLRDAQKELMAAGRSEDLDAAETVINTALASSVRPVDIMVGLVAPLLYRIGDEWQKGTICVAEEHRFTSFCESVFKLIEQRVQSKSRSDLDARRTRVLVMNSYGNSHVLGIRILALWLKSRNIDAQLLDPTPNSDDLIAVIRNTHPKALLVSTALAEQRSGLISIAEAIRSISGTKPALIVGGYAVKMRLITPIPETIFVTNICDLVDLI